MLHSRPAAYRVSIAFVLLVTATLIGACHQESPTCKALDQLNTSVQALRNVNVIQDGVPALQKAVQTVVTDAQSLKSAAGSEFGSEGTAFVSSIDDLKNAVQLAITSPSTANAAAAAGAVNVSITAYGTLKEAIPDCG